MCSRKRMLFCLIGIILIPSIMLAQAIPRLHILPRGGQLSVGDSLLFSVSYVDSFGSIDTNATWTISQDSLAIIDEDGWFFALSPGTCHLFAELDTLQDSVSVTIDDDQENPGGDSHQHLTVFPQDSLLSMGSAVQFYAYRGDTLVADSLLIWNLLGMPLGTLSENGLLQVTAAGFALVEAISGEYAGASYIMAADTSLDSSGVNHISITRDSPNPQGYTVMRELEEGEVWKMSGIPHPLNILNGSSVYFPMGSLSEDVRIHVSLPGFFQVGNDSVEFGHNDVVGGISFRVMTDDTTIVEPYYFNTPLPLGVVYKAGLLDHMGIDASMLEMYFASMEDDSLIFDNVGIDYTTVDEYHNRIYAAIAHFSDITVASPLNSVVRIDQGVQKPVDFILYQNYPNPFNPTTSISYSLPVAAEVTLSVFDISGRLVASLRHQHHESGTYSIRWNGQDQSGHQMGTGVYLCRLETGGYSQTIKMVYLK